MSLLAPRRCNKWLLAALTIHVQGEMVQHCLNVAESLMEKPNLELKQREVTNYFSDAAASYEASKAAGGCEGVVVGCG